MSDEITAEERDRAFKALRLLDNDLVREFFAESEARIIKAWKIAQNSESREALWYQMRSLTDLQAALTRTTTKTKVKEWKANKGENPYPR